MKPSTDSQDKSFKAFAHRMRLLYHGEIKGKFTEEHKKVLESIEGWTWDIKRNLKIIPLTIIPPILESKREEETDLEVAHRIARMYSGNKLSPMYFSNTINDSASKKLTQFREQYRNGDLPEEIENILLGIPESWTMWGDVCCEDIFSDKCDDYLCYNKLPNDIHYRCHTASHLAKPWHTQYLKKKLNIVDSIIPGEIFNFESSMFCVKFTNLLRDYFSGEQEKNITANFNLHPIGSI
jgi:hypothetical protein